MILSNGKIIAQDSPSNIVKNIKVRMHILVTTLKSTNLLCQILLKLREIENFKKPY